MAAIGQGQGAGLSQYFVGETTGSETVTLLTTEIPSHNHSFAATSTQGTTMSSAGNQLAQAHTGGKQASFTGNYLDTSGINVAMSPLSTTVTGGSQPHNNMQPYLTLNFCIAMQGVFPPRS
jgi:microcystin-dependent protein